MYKIKLNKISRLIFRPLLTGCRPPPPLRLATARVGNFRQKIIPRKTEQTEQRVISVGIPAVPRNRKSRNSVPNPSAEEKRTRNSVPLNKKQKQSLEFPFRSLQRKRKQLGIPFRGTNIEANSRNSVPNHSAEKKLLRTRRGSPKFQKQCQKRGLLKYKQITFVCFVKLDPDPQLKFRTKWSYPGYPFPLPCIHSLRASQSLQCSNVYVFCLLSRVCVHQQSTTMLVSLFCICIRGSKRLILLLKFFVECRLGSQSGHRGRASSAKLHFFAGFRSVSFRSELRNWLFRGTRNASKWALSSANNGNHSESIPRNFFGTKFRSQPQRRQVKII